ncbi:NAD-dependent epimerase/dehydratase family protein [Trinickia sp. LjRoot230]|uniref:NAD-dependent epimerase/dehydratase family protein n=1 Tax=Trinickia sp. LjRoot230 TaxID=3342288 RepID=UPI003ECD5289
MFNWSEKAVLVTGGASFIGSHLVDLLVERGVKRLLVVDDLSTGRRENIEKHLSENTVELVQADLLCAGVARSAMEDIDIVFHLAAIHGGRGYIDSYQAQCSRNFTLDGMVIDAAHRANIEKIVFTSSGCVYPVSLQSDTTRPVYLREDMVGPPYESDGIYGWAKLMAELTLRSYYLEYGLRSVSCRLFTAYGERCLESHAVIAMIGRAFLQHQPVEVWGDGMQIRNWTYVGDIVRGLVAAAEKISDATAINLGTEEPIRVKDAMQMILDHTGHLASIKLRPDMPTGPLNRVASHELATELTGWRPQVTFKDGLARTIDWYFKEHESQRDELGRKFDELLMKRTA